MPTGTIGPTTTGSSRRGTRLREWTGAILGSGGARTGVTFVLTADHLVLIPLKPSTAHKAFLALGTLSAFGESRVAADAALHGVPRLSDHDTEVAIPITDIVQIAPGKNASLFKPPFASVTFADGQMLEFGFGVSRRTPIFSRRNNPVRDDFVATLRPHIGKPRRSRWD